MFGNPEELILTADRCFINIIDGVEDIIEQNDDSAWGPKGNEGYVGVKLTQQYEVTSSFLNRLAICKSKSGKKWKLCRYLR